MEKYAVVFGGCNYDYTFHQKKDLSYSNKPNSQNLGGKGANQAVALARAGANVKIITVVGDDDNGKKILNNLKVNKVDTTYCKIAPNVKSDSCNIYVSIDGENDIQRITEAIDEFKKEMIAEYADVLKGASYIVTQSKLAREVYVALIEFCAENNVPLVLTPCPSNVLKFGENGNEELLKKVAIITANEKESIEITGEPDVVSAVLKFPNLIATAGAKGVFYNEGGKVVNIPACKVKKIVDTTGAGDTFCGNLVACLQEGKQMREAIKFGVCSSALKLAKSGAQLGMPYKKNVEKLLKKLEKHND